MQSAAALRGSCSALLGCKRLWLILRGAESPCQAWPSLGRVTGILRHMRLTYINDGWAEQRRCVVFAHCPEDPSNKAGAVTLDAA
mgnify:FL=1